MTDWQQVRGRTVLVTLLAQFLGAGKAARYVRSVDGFNYWVRSVVGYSFWVRVASHKSWGV